MSAVAAAAADDSEELEPGFTQGYLFGDTGDALVALEAKEGLYTGKRFLKQHPGRVRVLLGMKAMLSDRQVILAYKEMFGQEIHHATIHAVVDECPALMAELRASLEKRCMMGAMGLTTKLQEMLAGMDLSEGATAKEFQAMATGLEKYVNACNSLKAPVAVVEQPKLTEAPRMTPADIEAMGT